MSTKITIELIVPDSENINSDYVAKLLRNKAITNHRSSIIRLLSHLPLIKIEKCTDSEEDE